MTTYDFAKDQLVKSELLSDGSACHTVASAIAAGAAAVAMQPFDLVGSRMMNQPVSPEGKPLMYSGALDCMRKTVAAEGVPGLYKGLSANYLRMAPQYILTFVFYEKFMRACREFGLA